MWKQKWNQILLLKSWGFLDNIFTFNALNLYLTIAVVKFSTYWSPHMLFCVLVLHICIPVNFLEHFLSSVATYMILLEKQYRKVVEPQRFRLSLVVTLNWCTRWTFKEDSEWFSFQYGSYDMVERVNRRWHTRRHLV